MAASIRSLPALTEKTFLPLGLFVIALGAVAGGAWWLSAMYANQLQVKDNQVQLNARLDRIEKSFTENVIHLEQSISDNSKGFVSEHDMRIWVMSLKAQNDTLKIPEWVR